MFSCILHPTVGKLFVDEINIFIFLNRWRRHVFLNFFKDVFFSPFFHLQVTSTNTKTVTVWETQRLEYSNPFIKPYLASCPSFSSCRSLASPLTAAIMNIPPFTAASLWHGTNSAYVVWTVFPIKWTFLYIHIWCICSPRAIIHMTTLGAEGIAESLSLAKEQPHRVTPAELPRQAEYYFVLMKWPGPGQEQLTFRAQLTFFAFFAESLKWKS